MDRSAISFFKNLTVGNEGECSWMYVDVKGLVTTGRGNLINSVAAAQALPWRRPDGSLASPQEVAEAWQTVHDRRDELAPLGGFAHVQQAATSLRLDKQALEDLFMNTVRSFEKTLKGYFPQYDSWPMDAQVATMSMSWALGPAFAATGDWPRLTRALREKNFAEASLQCHLDENGNGGVHNRNIENKTMYENAAVVEARNMDRARIYFPASLVNGLNLRKAFPWGLACVFLVVGVAGTMHLMGKKLPVPTASSLTRLTRSLSAWV